MRNQESILTVKAEACWTALAGSISCVLVQGGEEYVLRCRYKFADQEAFQLGKPVMHWKVNVPSSKVNELLDRLRHLQIPAMPEFHDGCDGSIEELSFGGYMGSASYRWWVEAPKGWEELEKIHDEVVQLANLELAVVEFKEKSNDMLSGTK